MATKANARSSKRKPRLARTPPTTRRAALPAALKDIKPMRTVSCPVMDPAAYGLRATGDCLSPAVQDGDTVICSPSVKIEEGMIVAFHFKNGGTPKVKRLTFLPPPLHPRSEVEFLIRVEMDNPPASFFIDPEALDKMHTVVGVVRDGLYIDIAASRGKRAHLPSTCWG